MKTKFSTYDLVCSLTELQRFVGMRVNQVYDIDHKTYLIKLQRTEEKVMLLIESGCRIHTTAFEWPKNMAPSGFSMKMRKHLRNKRLEVLRQLGMDRIVDLQFGTGEAAYHVVLELYDRGNIVLTDCELTILNVLRPHTEGDKIKFAVREKYPVDRAHQRLPPPSVDQLREIFAKAKPGETLKKILNPHLEYGPAVIDHMLLKVGLPPAVKLGKGFDISQVDKIFEALQEAEALLDQALKQSSKGYIIQKAEKKPNSAGGSDELVTNQEFHPYLFLQHTNQLYKEFDCFDLAVDEFFSTSEAQKIDVKAFQQEREALKKLDNVRKDHVDRLKALQQTQEVDKQKAELILRNQELVESCLLVVRTALANQLPWTAIDQLINEARSRGDLVAATITKLKLDTNHITLHLSDPFGNEETSSEDDDEDEGHMKIEPMTIDIDLALTSFANAKKYYDKKRSAAKKQQKTVESQGKALKSAEKKTKQTLKEVQAMTTITKARKVFWFEKFFWFISSENYLVIGGRDQQQNELIVKRYLRGSDVYVHADLHGASSVVVKNPSSQPIPPKTLNEAGTMAICYSAAWEAKVHTSAWWVHADQVSKTAPTGEYLTTGSFMVRGKKNFLPPCHLIMGFSFLFKLEESSVERHKNERRVKTVEEEEVVEEVENDTAAEVELDLSDDEQPDEMSAAVLEDVEEEDEDEPRFPDTQIRVEHTNDNKVSVTAAVGSLNLQSADSRDEDETVVYLGDDQPVVIKPSATKHSKQNQRQQTKAEKKEKEDVEEKEKQNLQQVKRGQKGKLKKIKEKYKDQDEEERRLRMQILQSAGSGKVKDTKKGKKNAPKVATVPKKLMSVKPAPRPATVPAEGAGGESGGEEEGEPEGEGVTADVDMLDSLTGQPLPEDELLFAVPVIAPYNTMTNYKYKVKLTPGTGKRGKAAKTALNMFLRDRSATNHERDLLRSVKDQNMARNLPGKVKLSAPQLQKLKK